MPNYAHPPEALLAQQPRVVRPSAFTPEGSHISATDFAVALLMQTCDDHKKYDSSTVRGYLATTHRNHNHNLTVSTGKPSKSDLQYLGTALPVERKCDRVDSKYVLGTPISEGTFGVVHRADGKSADDTAERRHRSDNAECDFALKKIKDNWFTESRDGFPFYLLREMDLGIRLRHPNLMGVNEIVATRSTEEHYGLFPPVPSSRHHHHHHHFNSKIGGSNNNNTATTTTIAGTSDKGTSAPLVLTPANAAATATSTAATPSASTISTPAHQHPHQQQSFLGGALPASPGSMIIERHPHLGELCRSAPSFGGTRPTLHLVSDFGGRTLKHEMYRLPRPLCMATVKAVIQQLLRGVEFLHQHSIMHRDIKPNNILITADAQLKLCDLGLSRTLRTGQKYLSTNVVTRSYRAPELHLLDMRNVVYHQAVDVWSIGCIMAELLMHQPLFSSETEEGHMVEVVRALGVPTPQSWAGLCNIPGVMSTSSELPKITVRQADYVEAMTSYQAGVRRVVTDSASGDDRLWARITQWSTSQIASSARNDFVFSKILERRITKRREEVFAACRREGGQHDPTTDTAFAPLSEANRTISADCMDLLQSMLQWSPAARITCTEALQHPFFQLDVAPLASMSEVKARRAECRAAYKAAAVAKQQQQQQAQQPTTQQ